MKKIVKKIESRGDVSRSQIILDESPSERPKKKKKKKRDIIIEDMENWKKNVEKHQMITTLSQPIQVTISSSEI